MKPTMLVIRRTAIALREAVVPDQPLPPLPGHSPWPDRIAFWISAASAVPVGLWIRLHALPETVALHLQGLLGTVGWLLYGVLLYMMLGSAPALAVIAWLLKFWWVLALAGVAVRLVA